MKLFKVKVEVEFVYASHSEEGIHSQTMQHLNLDGTTYDIVWDQISSEDDLPSGWTINDIPFGTSLNDETISNLLNRKE